MRTIYMVFVLVISISTVSLFAQSNNMLGDADTTVKIVSIAGKQYYVSQAIGRNENLSQAKNSAHALALYRIVEKAGWVPNVGHPIYINEKCNFSNKKKCGEIFEVVATVRVPAYQNPK